MCGVGLPPWSDAVDELALAPNCTYGLQTGIMGAPIAEGDEILTTSHDYPRAFTAIKQRERRDRAVLSSVPIAAPPRSESEVTSDIVSRLNVRTKMVLLSQMTFTTGQLMPVRRIADALRGKDIALFVDAAHGIGLLPDRFRDMGADIYAACLHKWMMGPIGTGVFVVRSQWIKRLWPLLPAEPDLDDSIRKFEQFGTRSAAPFLALNETIDFHEMLGRERKAARLEALRRRLPDKVLNAPNTVLFSSLDPETCRAVLTIGFGRIGAMELASWLLEKHRIHVTTMVRAGLDGIRISPNVFTTEAEVDRLGTILDLVARNGIDKWMLRPCDRLRRQPDWKRLKASLTHPRQPAYVSAAG